MLMAEAFSLLTNFDSLSMTELARVLTISSIFSISVALTRGPSPG